MTAWILALLARTAMAATRCIMPAEQRDWLEAMAAELATLDAPADKLRWAFGCAAAASKLALHSGGGRFGAVSFALLVLTTLYDWRSADPTLTYLALVFVPGMLAYASPPRRWRIGLAFGLWLLGAHAAADLWPALRPHYQRFPLSPAEFVEIALVVAITVPAALLGACARAAPDCARRD